MDFTRQGAEVRGKNVRWRLETRGYGYGDDLRLVNSAIPQATGNRVEYRREGVTEWYENGPLGLEQGFTLAHRPGKANGRPLTLELNLPGDLAAAVEPAGNALALTGAEGKLVLRYSGLKTRDATGQALHSWLQVKGKRLLLRVDDTGARYPVVLDPWIQHAELSAADGAAGDEFGWYVAVDGTTAVVGAPFHTIGSNQAQGSAYVFVQNSDGTWSQQAELMASDGAVRDNFGWSVAVSGGTILVGAPGHDIGSNAGQGSAYVFVQNGDGIWSQQAELSASDGAANYNFGWSVAVSGSTALVGESAAEVVQPIVGAAYVFVQNGASWNQQTELTPSDGRLGDFFGNSVALDGGTLVVGAPKHTVGSNFVQGAAYVFGQDGASWGQQSELTAPDGAAGNNFGWSVAAGENTILVGEVAESPIPGAAYVFAGNGGTWTQQQELTAPDGAANDFFAYSVAVSDSISVTGAPLHTTGSNPEQGAAYLYGSSGPLYTLSAGPSNLSIVQGTQGTSTITIMPFNGFGGDVSLSASRLPTGSTAAFSPNPATSTSTLTLTASEFATTGTSTILVIGASGHLTQTATLTLAVTGATTVSLSPSSPNFGNEAIDTTSAAKIVTLENTGTVTLDIASIAVTQGADFAISSTTCGRMLAVDKTCRVSVTFSPTQLGTAAGTLTFTDNASGNPQSLPLSGTGVAQATVTPVNLSFGTQAVGTTSAAKNVTLKNNLPTALTGISYSTSAPFSISSSTCSTTLNSKATCTISVTFSPTERGPAPGTLSVTDSANNSPQAVNLSGTGN